MQMNTLKPINAIVNGLLDGGCTYTTNVPGAKSQDIFYGLGGESISVNERIAYEMVYGASLAGKRAVITLKNTGLTAACEPFIHSVLSGINGGLVVVVVDDVEALSSPERQDSRSLYNFYGGLWLEPMSSQMAYDMSYEAFDWSEKFDIPIVIRITNQYFYLHDTYKRKSKKKSSRGLSKERSKYISYWEERYNRLQEKNKLIKEFVRNKPHPVLDGYKKNEGVIVFGNCQRELKEKKYSKSQKLHINTYPFSADHIKSFTKDKTKISVLEQGTSYAFQWVLSILHPLSNPQLESNTGDLIDTSNKWIIWNQFERIFKALKTIKPSFVVGDEGQFTEESTKTIENCLCMGASVGTTLGMALNGVDYPFCVVGDASFVHGGIQSLTEAIYRKAKMGIIVIDNGGAQSTGGQKIAGDIYDINKTIKYVTLKYSESSVKQIASVLNRMRENKELAILYVDCK